MAMDNFAENVRDKSPPVTDPEALAVALSNVGTMSPRLRKLYDDAAALLRAQAAEIANQRPPLTDAPVCPWCDRQGHDICQHADDARTCEAAR